MLLPQWRVQFPEFRSVTDPLVQSMLNAAQLEIDAGIWGPKFDQGQAYLAAHKLAMSPFGQAAKMINKDGSTTYEKIYRRMLGQVASGFRVA